MLLLHFSVQCNPRQIQHLWILLALHQNGNASCSLKPPRRLPYSNCLCQPMWLCQLCIVTINCYLCWSSVEAFIRWGISVEALIRWSLAVEALSVEAYIRWCIPPLMHTSVDGCYPLKLCRVIRWCFILIRWSLQFISWHYFTYTKLQGMIYLQLTFLFAYPLIVNMTYVLQSTIEISVKMKRLKYATNTKFLLRWFVLHIIKLMYI